MTTTLSIELTAGQLAALEMDILGGVQEWLQNSATAKARSVVSLIPPAQWAQCLAAASEAGIAADDTDAIVLHGLEVGLLLSAEQLEAVREQERQAMIAEMQAAMAAAELQRQAEFNAAVAAAVAALAQQPPADPPPA